MKLQEKKQLSSSLQEQKRREIDEGVRLAQKVDLLRQEVQSLETQRVLFLESTKKETDSKVSAYQKRLETLSREVDFLEDKRRHLLEPITKELEELELSRISVKGMFEELTLREENILLLEKDISSRVQKLLKDERSIEEKLVDVESTYLESKRNHERSLSILENAVLEKERITSDIDSKYKEMEVIRNELESTRKFQEEKERVLISKEIELNEKEKAINDKYQTLLRTISRVENA